MSAQRNGFSDKKLTAITNSQTRTQMLIETPNAKKKMVTNMKLVAST